jgi:hypothetical protein
LTKLAEHAYSKADRMRALGGRRTRELRTVIDFVSSFVRLAALRTLLVLAGLCLLVACERSTPQLLEVSDVVREEETASLSMVGAGFPAGRTGSVQFVGVLHQQGKEPKALRFQLPCRALSEGLAIVDLREAQVGPGIFEGRLELTFESAVGTAADVGGELQGARIRFDASGSRALADALGYAQRAAQFRREVGLSELEPSPAGLVVTQIGDDSLVAQAGLRRGDQLERLDGSPVEELTDLVPRDSVRVHVLDVLRADGTRERLRLEGNAQAPGYPPLLPWVAFVVALLVTLPLVRSHARAPHLRLATDLKGLGLTLVVALACLVLEGTLDARVLFFSAAFARLATSASAFARRRIDGQGLLEDVIAVSAMAMVLTTETLLHGNATEAPFGVAEHLSPSSWLMFAAPPAWLALLTLRHAQLAERGPWGFASTASWLRFTNAVCAVALLAEGGSTPWLASSGPLAILSAVLVWGIKVACVVWLLGGRKAHGPLSLRLGAAILAPASAWLWMSLEAPALLTAILGPTALGILLACGARTLFESKLPKQSAAHDPSLSPFL